MGTPSSRRLRIFGFDPSLTNKIDTYLINEITVKVPWEEELLPGPIGEYIEVIDYDPAADCIYEPVDLNAINTLASDGIKPSSSNPHFHQQMTYAVAMTTIRHFESALGRVAFWGDHVTRNKDGYVDQFVRRLRIYPHGLRDQNAFYSPSKKAILFGYFPVLRKDSNNTPGTIVFTCLSHGIIAHEVTHALLDGVHRRFNEATNPDVLAFHEAFSDIVALFQLFTYKDVLIDQIRKTRGNLHAENLLSQLAQEFGNATGRGNSLRDALGRTNKKGEWKEIKPDPNALDNIKEPHRRGAILVSAIFKAFLLIYRSHTADLFRIASNGTGVLPDGEIHPDLSNRLAYEAAKCAQRVLYLCIRAIDYCPPVDITFGDFLRALITADIEYAPEDEKHYRVAIIESFREWGIYPDGVTSMGIDALTWPSGQEIFNNLKGKRDYDGMKQYMKDHFLNDIEDWNLESVRFEIWKKLGKVKAKFWQWLKDGDYYGEGYAEMFGLVISMNKLPGTVNLGRDGLPAVEVHAVRPTIRKTLRGGNQTDLVVEITQSRKGYFNVKTQEKYDLQAPGSKMEKPDFIYRAGCTLFMDPTTQEIRRIIRTKGTISDDNQLKNVRIFLTGEDGAIGNAFDTGIRGVDRSNGDDAVEPFSLLHGIQNL